MVRVGALGDNPPAHQFPHPETNDEKCVDTHCLVGKTLIMDGDGKLLEGLLPLGAIAYDGSRPLTAISL